MEVLTYALLEALDIKAAHGGDDRVRVNSLADYVEQRVPEISKSSFGGGASAHAKADGQRLSNRHPAGRS